MAARSSAGILPFRRVGGDVEVLIGHPGGPFWANKDTGAWSVIKGEVDPEEDQQAAALREFTEETGSVVAGDLLPLGMVTQKSGKVVTAWAVEMDLDATSLRSNTFTMEWPPRSGRTIDVPEIDDYRWFDAAEATAKLNPAQAVFVTRLIHALDM